MEITLTQQSFSKALNYVSKAASTKPNIPVLSNVLLEVSKDSLTLSTTNLEMGISVWIAGNNNVPGSLTVSSKFLTDFINANAQGNLKLSMSGESLKVNTENAVASFAVIPSAEFPTLPKPEAQPLATFDYADFVTLLPKALFATASESNANKVQYTGALFDLKSSQSKMITVVGLNSYRLSKVELSATSEVTEDTQLIIPAKGLQEVLKIVQSEQPDTIALHLSQNKSLAFFKFNQVEVSIRLIEGPYPNYSQVIPSSSATSFVVNKEELGRALKIVNTFARSSFGFKVEMDIDTESKSIVLRSKVPDLGINETKVALLDISSTLDLNAAYNLQYLMDLVDVIDGKEITYQTNSALQPAVFTSKVDKGFLHIIMPLVRD